MPLIASNIRPVNSSLALVAIIHGGGRSSSTTRRLRAVSSVLPQPTGTRNRDALGNAAPKVNDHRDEKPKTSSTSSNIPPAAAAPGTASTTAVTNPAAQGGTRDHRKGGSSGGVTMTQTPKSSSGQGDRGGKDRQRQ